MKYLILIFILLSCKSKSTPEGALKEFVNLRYSEGQTKEKVLSYLEGAFYEKVSTMSDDEFKSYSNTSDLKKTGFKISVKNCNESSCYLTYVVKYVQTKNKNSHKIEAKKIAELEKVDNSWKIIDVNDVKSYIESSNTIEP